MSDRKTISALLFASLSTLALGFFIEAFWIASGLLGLIPAITWLINDLRHKTMGSDVLAVLALLGALFTDELFAAAVISVMLATGRVLESWAEGQAERQLKALLSRMPRNVHRVEANGSIKEIDIEQVNKSLKENTFSSPSTVSSKLELLETEEPIELIILQE